jgi:hypothetical protein
VRSKSYSRRKKRRLNKSPKVEKSNSPSVKKISAGLKQIATSYLLAMTFINEELRINNYKLRIQISKLGTNDMGNVGGEPIAEEGVKNRIP